VGLGVGSRLRPSGLKPIAPFLVFAGFCAFPYWVAHLLEDLAKQFRGKTQVDQYPRLEARPVATLSIEAQERHEWMEKKHRDELLLM